MASFNKIGLKATKDEGLRVSDLFEKAADLKNKGGFADLVRNLKQF
jgi:hypothetical protein